MCAPAPAARWPTSTSRCWKSWTCPWSASPTAARRWLFDREETVMTRSPLTSAFLLLFAISFVHAQPLFAQTDGTVPRLPSVAQSSVSPLADAAMRRDMARVRALLVAEEGIDVNAFGSNGTAALHWAARYGDLETVDWLLARGADPDLANDYGARPLAIAIENGHLDLARHLLEAGADPE